jgi:hypothetical protein
LENDNKVIFLRKLRYRFADSLCFADDDADADADVDNGSFKSPASERHHKQVDDSIFRQPKCLRFAAGAVSQTGGRSEFFFRRDPDGVAGLLLDHVLHFLVNLFRSVTLAAKL